MPPASSAQLAVLLDRVAMGDLEAFAELYAKTSARLYGIVLRICRSVDLANDALHEAYLKIWTTAGAYDAGTAAALPWMANITRNAALDAVRRLGPDGAGRHAGAEDPLTAGAVEPAPDMDQYGALSALMGCLGVLPGDARHMLLLAYFDGVDTADLGERFARPQKAVKAVLCRSLFAVMRCLND